MPRLKTPTGNPSLDRELRSMDTAIDTAATKITQGVLLTGIQLKDGVAQLIATGLGRKVQGWLVVDLVDPVTTGRIERIRGGTDFDRLNLKATGWGATITVSLWVF